MRIAILYICTGNYRIFWKDFYLSAEKNLLPEADKHYFVFSDERVSPSSKKVHFIYQQALDWPYSALFRFKFFSRIEKIIEPFDYVYFFNGNSIFLKKIGREILPDRRGQLVGAAHPAYFFQPRSSFTYETNPDSNAYIAENEGKYYLQSGLMGGAVSDFLMISRTLSPRVDADLEKGIIAVWHDESHWNKYVLDKDIKVLPPDYIYAENMWIPGFGYKPPFEKIIMMRDKNLYGGTKILRRRAGKTTFFFINALFYLGFWNLRLLVNWYFVRRITDVYRRFLIRMKKA